MKKFNFNESYIIPLYNKYSETYLNESFFDDIDDDVFDMDAELGNTITNTALSSVLTEINNIAKDLKILITYDYKTTIAYYESLDRYNSFTCYKQTEITKFLKILSLLHDLGCKHLLIPSSIASTYSRPVITGGQYLSDNNEILDDVLDFYNINIPYIYIKNVIIKNFYATAIEKNLGLIGFEKCTFDNINIGDIDTLYLENCKNIKDFSFIKNVKSIEFKVCSQDTYTASKNLNGLPEKLKKMSITIHPEKDITLENASTIFEPGNTFVGISPNTNINILLYSRLASWVIRKEVLMNMFSNFSLEGLSDEQIMNSIITYSAFRGRPGGLILQFGPHKLEPKTTIYKLSNAIRQYLVKTHNFFVECYDPLIGPKKTFDESQIDKKIILKIDNAELRKQLKKEDEELLLSMLRKQALKYIHIDDKFKMGKCIISIKKITDNYIMYDFVNMRNLWSSRTCNDDWKKFLKMIENWSYKPEDSEKTLRELIIDPVMKKWEKVKAQLKEKRKLERKQQKEADNIKIDDSVEDIPAETSTKKIIPNPRNTVEIKQYSDKSIALFGNTYPIKDKIKELGGKYNPRLKYDENTYKPGWVVSKKKENEIKKLIG